MYSTSRIANCSKKLFVRLERCPSTHPSTIRPRSRLPWKPRDSLCRARICLSDCHHCLFNISQKVENLISISRLKGCRSVNNSFILYNSFLASIRNDSCRYAEFKTHRNFNFCFCYWTLPALVHPYLFSSNLFRPNKCYYWQTHRVGPNPWILFIVSTCIRSTDVFSNGNSNHWLIVRAIVEKYKETESRRSFFLRQKIRKTW